MLLAAPTRAAPAPGDPPAALPQFRLHLLGAEPGQQTTARAVDEQGGVAGVVTISGQVIQAAWWPAPGAPPVLATGDGADFSIASDVNASGVVVGTAGEGALAFTWIPGQDLVVLPTLGPCCPAGNAIHDDGTVVGFSVFGGSAQLPTRWNGGAPQNLGVVPGDATGLCHDISPSGIIVGQSQDEAALWQGGAVTRLPFPGDVLFSIAYGVNDLGHAVGDVSTGGPSHAVLWRGGAPIELPDLGGSWSMARAINAQGWIVGLAQGVPAHPGDINARGTLWLDGQPVALDSLVLDMPSDVRLDMAFDVSDSGFIVGEAWSVRTGLTMGYLLEPVDPTWTDLGHALAGAAGLPLLEGEGTLQPGSPVTLRLANAAPTANATLVLGLSALEAPFKGGVMVPSPLLLVGGLLTSAAGGLQLDATWPNGAPSGTSLYTQFWIVDAGGPAGLAASNGLRGTTP